MYSKLAANTFCFDGCAVRHIRYLLSHVTGRVVPLVSTKESSLIGSGVMYSRIQVGVRSKYVVCHHESKIVVFGSVGNNVLSGSDRFT